MLPLSLPGFVVVGIFQFTNIWNDFLFGVTILPNPKAQPVTVALNNFSGVIFNDWTVVRAGAAVAALPTALVYVLFWWLLRASPVSAFSERLVVAKLA